MAFIYTVSTTRNLTKKSTPQAPGRARRVLAVTAPKGAHGHHYGAGRPPIKAAAGPTAGSLGPVTRPKMRRLAFAAAGGTFAQARQVATARARRLRPPAPALGVSRGPSFAPPSKSAAPTATAWSAESGFRAASTPSAPDADPPAAEGRRGSATTKGPTRPEGTPTPHGHGGAISLPTGGPASPASRRTTALAATTANATGAGARPATPRARPFARRARATLSPVGVRRRALRGPATPPRGAIAPRAAGPAAARGGAYASVAKGPRGPTPSGPAPVKAPGIGGPGGAEGRAKTRATAVARASKRGPKTTPPISPGTCRARAGGLTPPVKVGPTTVGPIVTGQVMARHTMARRTRDRSTMARSGQLVILTAGVYVTWAERPMAGVRGTFRHRRFLAPREW